jgi:hypothetical protein
MIRADSGSGLAGFSHRQLVQNVRTTSAQSCMDGAIFLVISPAELRVTVGGAVIKQEPMIDYRGPAL